MLLFSNHVRLTGMQTTHPSGEEKNSPVIRPDVGQERLGFKLGITTDTITSKSGLAVFHEAALAAGVVRSIREHLPVPGSNHGIRPEAYVMPLALMFCGGGQSMEDIREIARDQGLRELCGFKRIPSPDAVGTWLKAPRRITGLKQVNRHLCRVAIARSELTEFTLDTDATLIETEKSSAKMSYEGFKAFAPLLSFLAELGLCVAGEYRNGNVSPAVGIKGQLVQTERFLKSLGKRLKYFRSDSAAYTAEVMNACFDSSITFAITADLDHAVKGLIAELPEQSWQRFQTPDGERTDREYAETAHCLGKSKRSFTLIVLRWPNPRPDLFEGQYRYHCIATNDYDRATEPVIWFHNQRGNAENYNKEIKIGFGMDYTPCRSVRANAVYFEIGILAYNLVAAVKPLVLGGNWVTKTIATLRWQLIFIAGKVVWHGRRLMLRVARCHYHLLADIRARLGPALSPT
jgi:hypothetical protein